MKRALVLAGLASVAACTTPADRDGGFMDGGETQPTIPTGAASASAGSHAPPPQLGNETTSDQALSVVDLGEFQGPMSTPLLYMFRERHPDAPADYPITSLEYSAGKADGRGLIMRMNFSGEPTTVRLGVDGYVGIWEFAAGDQWSPVGGTATIRPNLAGGRSRVDLVVELEGIEFKQRRLLTGSIEGELWVQCYELKTETQPLVDANGKPLTITQHAWDEDWSSPFCASVNPK